MTYKFLSLLFFCGVCISTFGQDLQSPQINQNGIFANPGLAGSKGCLRLNSSINYFNKSSAYQSSNSQGYQYKDRVTNTLLSMDGLIWKNRIGVAGYLKNETNNMHSQYVFLNTSGQEYFQKQTTFNYHNMYAGLMVAPKFYIGAKDPKKIGRTLSPAIALGFKATQVTYTGDDTLQNYSAKTPLLYNGFQTSYANLDYLSLGVLYSSPKSYIGLKANFKQVQDVVFLSDLSMTLAKSFYNKRSAKPDFSFNPQLYVSIPMNQLRRNYTYQNYYGSNSKVLTSVFCLNLDFRYKKFLFGSFVNWIDYYGVSLGLTAGVQLENMKITFNYSHLSSSNGLFLSANFYLRARKERYR